MTAPHELPDAPPALVEQLRSGEVVAFVGDAVAAEGGAPRWDDVLRGVCDEALTAAPQSRQDIATAWQLLGERPLAALRSLAGLLGDGFLDAARRHARVRRRFEVRPAALVDATRGQGVDTPWTAIVDPAASDPLPTTNQRMILQLGLRGLLTCGLDDTLERSLDPRAPVHEAIDFDVRTLVTGATSVLRLHRGLLAPWPNTSLPALLTDRTLLWIGLDRRDPGLDILLDGCRALGLRGGFAVVTAGDPPPQRLLDLGVDIVELPRPEDLHAFLQRLALALARPVGFTARFTSRTAAGRPGKRRGLDLEELFASFGIDVNSWQMAPGSAVALLETPAHDFRRLLDLLLRRDPTLFDALAALGVAACNLTDIDAPILAPPVRPSPPRRTEPRPILVPGPARPGPSAAVYVPAGPPAIAVSELLVQLFSSAELRAWILKLPVPDLVHDLQLDAPLQVVALQLAEALMRHGLITPALLDSLRADRPYRSADIDALARHLFPATAATAEVWDSYTLFCRLLDRDSAWNKLARKCDVQDGPIFFLLHGTPNQYISLFMDRAHRFLDDEAKDGVRREHQVFEVMFERDYARLQTAEEWEATFRRAMGFGKGRPLADYLRRALSQQAIMFIVRGRNAAPLTDLNPSERGALAEFLRTRLPAALASLQPPHRAVRVLLGVEHAHAPTRGDPLFESTDAALRTITSAERVVLTLHFPTLDEVLESVDKFLDERLTAPATTWPLLRARCEAIYRRHEALGELRNYRDLADDLYRELDRLLVAHHT